MGLFVRRENEESVNYTISTSTTLIIVGLGNPGKEYENTRHNVGFVCIDALKDAQTEFSSWQEKTVMHCNISSGNFGQTKVILVKPTTFMNESGRAVQKVLNFYKLSSKQLSVVHDELDIPFGQIRTRQGGGHAGHNGIRSVIQYIGDDFGRVRIGIDNPAKPDQQDSADYVLGKFNKKETAEIPKLTREVQSTLVELVYRGELYADTRNFLL